MKKQDAMAPLSAATNIAAEDYADNRLAPALAPPISESVRRALASHYDDADYMSSNASS